MRLQDKVAIVVGAGQARRRHGNGRATALTFAREGAKVVCVDHNLASAQETVDIIGQNQGTAVAFKADVTKEAEIKALVADTHARGAGSTSCTTMSASGCRVATRNSSTSPKRRSTVAWRSNLKSCIFAARNVLPIMREQKSGVIIDIFIAPAGLEKRSQPDHHRAAELFLRGRRERPLRPQRRRRGSLAFQDRIQQRRQLGREAVE